MFDLMLTAAAQSGPRKPDLLCIGAQKAGTSWLHEMLGGRPDVWTPPFKELHFFDHKFLPAHRTWTRRHIEKGVEDARARHFAKGLNDADFLAYLDRIGREPMFNGQWYRHVFSRAAPSQICLDVTPEYGCLPPEGVAFVARFLKDARFIFILREPVARALSQMRMNAARTWRFDGSAAAWRKIADDPDVIDRGRYSVYLPRWKAAFGDRLLVLPFGRIARDPAGLMAEIAAFAGLPRHDHSGLERVVWSSPPAEVPAEVVDLLRQRTAGETAFLRNSFGADFLRDC